MFGRGSTSFHFRCAPKPDVSVTRKPLYVTCRAVKEHDRGLSAVTNPATFRLTARPHLKQEPDALRRASPTTPPGLRFGGFTLFALALHVLAAALHRLERVDDWIVGKSHRRSRPLVQVLSWTVQYNEFWPSELFCSDFATDKGENQSEMPPAFLHVSSKCHAQAACAHALTGGNPCCTNS